MGRRMYADGFRRRNQHCHQEYVKYIIASRIKIDRIQTFIYTRSKQTHRPCRVLIPFHLYRADQSSRAKCRTSWQNQTSNVFRSKGATQMLCQSTPSVQWGSRNLNFGVHIRHPHRIHRQFCINFGREQMNHWRIALRPKDWNQCTDNGHQGFVHDHRDEVGNPAFQRHFRWMDFGVLDADPVLVVSALDQSLANRRMAMMILIQHPRILNCCKSLLLIPFQLANDQFCAICIGNTDVPSPKFQHWGSLLKGYRSDWR